MAKKKRTLTQRFVDSVKAAPEGKRDRYFDKLTPNFALSVTDKAAKSHAVFLRWPGSRHSAARTIGNAKIITLSKARQIALEWQRGALEGIDPLRLKRAIQQPVKTVRAALDDYARGHLADLRRGNDVDRLLRRELKAHLDHDIRSVTSDDVLRIIAQKYDAGRRTMSNLVRAYISGFYTFAVARKWVDKNPVAEVKRQHKPKKRGRDRVLSDLEIGAILRAADKCEGPMARALRMLLLTACRRSEVQNADWNEVDLAEGKWTIPAARMKNNLPAIIPLTSHMLAANVMRPEIRTGNYMVASQFVLELILTNSGRVRL